MIGSNNGGLLINSKEIQDHGMQTEGTEERLESWNEQVFGNVEA